MKLFSAFQPRPWSRDKDVEVFESFPIPVPSAPYVCSELEEGCEGEEDTPVMPCVSSSPWRPPALCWFSGQPPQPNRSTGCPSLQRQTLPKAKPAGDGVASAGAAVRGAHWWPVSSFRDVTRRGSAVGPREWGFAAPEHPGRAGQRGRGSRGQPRR